MDDEIATEVKRIFAEREKKAKAADFKAWCDEMIATPHNWAPALQAGYVADVELQPHWWLREGVDLIECRHVDSQVELFDGKKGPVMQSHLPYAVFLAATEAFLKGMYLCRFPECRQIAACGYIRPARREHHVESLKEFGHHLPNLIAALGRMKAYRTDIACVRFLAIINGVVRRFYYPLRDADKKWGWATARYPKRFYNETTKDGRSDGMRTFPQQGYIETLFKAMERHLDKKWNLRRGLIERRKARRARFTKATASSVSTHAASFAQQPAAPSLSDGA
jgi:hypothetical protein